MTLMTHILLPGYKQRDHKDPGKNIKCLESVLLSLCPERDLSESNAGSEEAYDVVVELSCFSGLIFLAAPSNAYREHLLQALPSDNYTSHLGEVHRTL